jgi:hypothetical protein
MTEFTDQAVYFVLEHDPRGDDRVVLLFEDDPDTLTTVIEYCLRLASGDSQICTGRFHAATPGDEYLEVGDWYLQKCHGVAVSQDLSTAGGGESAWSSSGTSSYRGP